MEFWLIRVALGCVGLRWRDGLFWIELDGMGLGWIGFGRAGLNQIALDCVGLTCIELGRSGWHGTDLDLRKGLDCIQLV